MVLIADVFPEIPAAKNMVRKMFKKPCLRGPLDREHGNQSKHSSNLNDSTFTKFINHCEGTCIGKSLF